jgi:hypothetical protein
MPIRTAGALPITEIINEFGGSTPHGLSEYYGDGSFINNVYFPTTPKIPNKGSAINIGAFYGKSKRRVLSVEINSYLSNVDIFSLFRPSLVGESLPIDAVLIIKAGVRIGGDSDLMPMSLGYPDPTRNSSFRSGDTLTIENYGSVIGRGGEGGRGGVGSSANSTGSPTNGEVGLPAMILRFPVTINNYGTIASGGRGGKGGNGKFSLVETITSYYNCGPIVRDCISFGYGATPAPGIPGKCAYNGGERAGCGDDTNIPFKKCSGSWLRGDRNFSCGCNSCVQVRAYKCTVRTPGRPKRCEADARNDVYGRYYCACSVQCFGGYGNVPSASVQCPNISKVEEIITGGNGGRGQSNTPAIGGTDSTPKALAECRGEVGGAIGSNTGIVAMATVRVNGNAVIGGVSAIYI